MNKKLLFQKKQFIYIFSIIAAIILGLGQYLKGTYQSTPISSYNNFLIFKNSFWNLINNINLYVEHQNQHDLFKYSPLFSLLFAPFSIGPDWVGLILWSLCNIFTFTYSIYSLSFLSDNQKAFVFWFSFPELMGSVQNLQSNALLAALLILAFSSSILNQNTHKFALYNVLNWTIKIYGFIGLSFAWLKKEIRFKYTYITLFYLLISFLIPFIFASDVKQQYLEWIRVLSTDHNQNYGMSLLGLIRHVVGDYPKFIVQFIGIILYICSLYKASTNKSYLHFLLFTLVWIIVFNHRTESPTLIVSTVAAAIWYISYPLAWKQKFIYFFFIFTSLGTSDLMPEYLRYYFFHVYDMKVLPSCILAFIIFTSFYYKNENFDKPLIIQ